MHVEQETTVDSKLENKQSRNMPSVVTASVLPYQYLTSKGILKFNRVQVKPQQCTWEQSCAAHSCCCVALRRKLQKNWLGPDPKGKPKGPFKEPFIGRGTYYSSDLMHCLLNCPSIPLLSSSFSSPGADGFPSQLCQNALLKIFCYSVFPAPHTPANIWGLEPSSGLWRSFVNGSTVATRSPLGIKSG